MMDLDEAIQHCEEVADTPCFTDEEAKCYSEHRQLAEWLKELKAYREQGGDAISRQAVIDTLTKTSGIRGDALKALYDLPSVTPQQKVGRWIIKDGEVQGYDIAGVKTWCIQIMCDKCGFIKTAIEGHIGEYKFCPKCGQPKMQEVEE